jgi:hypothetical protein
MRIPLSTGCVLSCREVVVTSLGDVIFYDHRVSAVHAYVDFEIGGLERAACRHETALNLGRFAPRFTMPVNDSARPGFHISRMIRLHKKRRNMLTPW